MRIAEGPGGSQACKPVEAHLAPPFPRFLVACRQASLAQGSTCSWSPGLLARPEEWQVPQLCRLNWRPRREFMFSQSGIV